MQRNYSPQINVTWAIYRVLYCNYSRNVAPQQLQHHLLYCSITPPSYSVSSSSYPQVSVLSLLFAYQVCFFYNVYRLTTYSMYTHVRM